jgi:hypothetical protein
MPSSSFYRGSIARSPLIKRNGGPLRRRMGRRGANLVPASLGSDCVQADPKGKPL